MREKEIENRISKMLDTALGKPVAEHQLNSLLELFHTNKPELVTENTIDDFVRQAVEDGKASVLKKRFASVHHQQSGELLSEDEAVLYYEYHQALRANGIESLQGDDITKFVSQYASHLGLYREYRKQLKVIGSRAGLESTLSAEEVDLLFEDLQEKRSKEPNLSVQQFVRDYIDDVRTLYQLCRGKNFPEVEHDWCANEYKRERAEHGISPAEFIVAYSLSREQGTSRKHQSDAAIIELIWG